jgi:uncharacterized protein
VRRSALASMALLLGAFTSCGSGDDGGGGSAGDSDTGRSASGTSVTSRPPSSSRSTGSGSGEDAESDGGGGPACPQNSLENCFTASEMQDLVDVVLPFVRQFFEAQYQAMPEPEGLVYVPAGESGRSGCADGFDGDTLAYCPSDRRIYLGQAALWQLYDRFGDAAPVLVIAHEWTHHAQHMTDVPMGDRRVPNSIIPAEDQADCGAGAFMKYADEQGWLEYPDDLRDVGGALRAAGELDGPNRTHGTIQERIDSFSLGFVHGLRACNQFIPASPIIS